jgi:ACS family hexuronate transporter-like MFS transporter
LAVNTLEYRSPAEDRTVKTNYRWMICALLFGVTTINYCDRQMLSNLKSTLQAQLHFDDASYGWITFAFTTGYAIMYVLAGRFIDRMGIRKGLAIAVAIWGLASMGHSLVQGVVGFAVARLILAMGESANFPAAIKATAQWFPKRERALSTGLFNAGSNVGLMLATPIFLLAVNVWHHWQLAFLITGSMDMCWLLWWLAVYHSPETHPRVSPSELEYIRDGADLAPVRKLNIPWTTILRQRQAWPFLIGKFMTDPVWWFFLFWMPGYLNSQHHMSISTTGLSLLIPYTVASVGSIAGGWLSGNLIRRGFSVPASRYLAMGVSAICMPISIYAAFTGNSYLCIALISLALASHQGWSANIFTTATDMFPPAVAGSVVGLGGTAGAIGGMVMTLAAGIIINYAASIGYVVMFIWAGLMYPLSLVIYFLFVGTKRTQADVVHESHKLSYSLLASGVMLCVLGAIGVMATSDHWQSLVKAMKGYSGAAAAVAVMSLFIVIGALLIYASLGRTVEQRGFDVLPPKAS